jgi:hypothetical protein
MCHGGARVGTVSLSSSDSHSDCQENNSRAMVARSGPLVHYATKQMKVLMKVKSEL